MNKKLSYFISSIVLVASMALFPAQSALAGNKTSSRYHGSNRYSTATSIANKLKHDKFNNVVIAYGYNFPDALSGSVLASKVNAPVILVPAKGNVPKQKQFVDNNNVQHVIAVGGESVVSKQVVNDLLGITTPQKPNPQTPKTPKEIEQRLPELGLTLVNSGYGQTDYMPSSQNFVVSVIGNQRLSLTLYQNNTTDAETIKTILNWALPTSGNEIYNILTKKQFTSQFITRDGIASIYCRKK